ncbi:MAG: hypothetical protein KGL44_04550 [Sphingomonadales bacterium]|nr:hypothetical protein [Sphingomonadales bacterium]
MIHPTCTEVLATVQTAFDEQVVPHLADSEARSAAATIGHLLRHVALRIEQEGQILSDDIARLEALLGRIADWFDETRAADAQPLRAALVPALPAGRYPSLTLIGERALALRAALVAAQERLQEAAAGHGSEAGYTDLRAGIRDYIAAQLADEARLIAPAFQGRGPRR